MKTLTLVFAAMLIAFGCQRQASDQLATSNPNLKNQYSQKAENFFPVGDYPKYKPNEIVVKFRPGTNKRILDNKKFRKVETATMKMARFKSEPYYQVSVPDVQKSLNEFRSNPDVEYAGLNPAHTTQEIFTPNDPSYTGGGQWNLGAIEVEKVWQSGNTGSKTVYIAVLDEGAGYWFCDYDSKVWTNQEEMNGVTGVDDDHNGHIDDYRGWNYFNGNNLLYTGNDDHGTWCGSMIGAEGGNNLRIVSVAPNIKVIHYKFLADYGFDSEAAKAIDDIIWLKVNKGLNIVAISNSWGGGGPTEILKDAIHRAMLADINFVCAAGNSNQNTVTNPMYPAAYDEPNIMSVGASTQSGQRAWFSNYSTDTLAKTAVDLFAPGVNARALLPINHQEGEGEYSGTSMACPLVSAAIGLLASVNPEMNYLQRHNAILATVKKNNDVLNLCKSGGILNLNNPIYFGATDPVVPNFTCGTPPAIDVTKPTPMVLTLDSIVENPVTGQAAFYIKWIRSTDANPITQQIFFVTPNWEWWFSPDFDHYRFELPMDRLYTINATSSDSWGNWSDPSNIIEKDYSNGPPPQDQIPPTTPTGLGADNIGQFSFRLFWNASTDQGGSGMKDYQVHWKPKGRSFWSMTFSTQPSTLLNAFIDSNTVYECMVLARDHANNLSDSSEIIEVKTLGSGAPPATCTIASNLNATSQSLNVTLSWTFNITGTCTVQSTRLERKKNNSSYSAVAFDPTNPYQDNVPTPGNYTYRLAIVSSTGQLFYSNEKQIQVKRK